MKKLCVMLIMAFMMMIVAHGALALDIEFGEQVDKIAVTDSTLITEMTVVDDHEEDDEKDDDENEDEGEEDENDEEEEDEEDEEEGEDEK